MNNSNIRMQVLCALFAAFCAVCSQLTIPIQPVPITLGTFAVLLAGGFLGSRYGLMSIVIYLLLGVAGVPVFSMMRSGVSVIAGPAGGFIIGFAVMAFVTGLISEKYGYSFKTMLIASVCGTLGLLYFGDRLVHIPYRYRRMVSVSALYVSVSSGRSGKDSVGFFPGQ